MPEHSVGGVRLEAVRDGIAVLRLVRSRQLNALTDTAIVEIGRLLDRVASDSKIRVLILTGTGRGFCAGFDLSLAGDAARNDELGEAPAWTLRQEAFASLVASLRDLPQPVIAAVNGPAHGAGFGLALACEIRIAGRSALFNSAVARAGLSSCDIGVRWLLPRCVGMSRAFDIMLTGRMVSAFEAERIGLVSEIVDDERLLSRSMEVAGAIAANSAFGVSMTKRGTWANVESGSLHGAIELGNRTPTSARATGDLSYAVARRRSA